MKGNIIIVDDAPEALKLLKDILTEEGHEVRPFINGELALRSAATEPTELIILDIRMPGMDGFEVCRRIKANDQLNEIPVIFISAATDIEDKVTGFQIGGADYITKPFQKEEAVARVKNHLSLYRAKQDMKRVEAALRKSEESLKIAQAVAHVGHWEWDMNTGEVKWSDETYRILGYDPQEVAPSHNAFLQAVHPDDREMVMERMNQTEEGSSYDIEYRMVMADGKVRVVHGIGKVLSFGVERRPRIIGTIQFVPDKRTEMLGVIQDITDRKEMEWRLEEEARTDALTGSLTRRYFLQKTEHELARVRRYGGEMSLLMLDLDHFKTINDTYGHQVGDLVLQKLVQVCRSALREEDIIGRLGGEEFAIMLPETGGVKAFDVAERLRKLVASSDVPMGKGNQLRFTTSIGEATLHEDDNDIYGMVRRADKSLYEAKNMGRNRVCAAA